MGNLKTRLAASIRDKNQRQALGAAMRRGRDGRAAALLTLKDPEEFKNTVRATKEHAIAELDHLIDQFTYNASKKGAKVFFAKDGPTAIRYVVELAMQKNAKLIVKSKSQTTEEIEFNHPLEELGFEVVETDLGERIIQLAKEKPIHLVFPAAHKTVRQVADVFSRESGKPISPDYGEIMDYVRRSLREVFFKADVGVTGANIAIAETGTLVIETNEGNGRLVSSLPNLQVTLVGVEKIVPSIETALDMIQAHPISATGQKLTTYVSFMSGRSPLRGREGSRELHIILLDNGRSAMRQDTDFREALYCIRCGACMNICPTFEVAGGHVFGYIYPGPISIPWTASVHGLDKSDYASLCIACGLCHEMCPVDIDIPYLIAKVKELNRKKSGQSFANSVVMRSDDLAKLVSSTAPISNWILRRRAARFLLHKLMGIESKRRLPTFTRKSFDKWWSHHTPIAAPDRRVAYFVDVYANYNRPDIGVAAVGLLEKAGAKVEVPPQRTSGMPYFSYGELDKLRAIAQFNVSSMAPLVRDGLEVVATEPTAAYCFREIYPRILDTEESRLVAFHTHELLDYLWKEKLTEGYLPNIFRSKVGLHISCHQRAMTMGKGTISLLSGTGLDVKVIETGTCCGMGGTFGLKAGELGYELSTEVGKPLFELFRKEQIEFGLTESSVCTIQLEEGTGLSFEHPVAVLWAAVENRTDYLKRLEKHV